MIWKDLLTSHLDSARRPLIVVLGPTASGKTVLSLDLAECVRLIGLRGEVVNADSRQLYRYLDIGTGKIPLQAMRGVAHHLLDVRDPREEVTAAWYKGEAASVINAILARGNVPILVGGSMLYISALIDDLEFSVSSDPTLRRSLEAEYDIDGGTTLYHKLMSVDPETASAFSPKNRPYVIRAMEIFTQTGEKPSSVKIAGTCPWDLLMLGVQLPRDLLAQRIAMRISEMFAAGWMDEVRGLISKGYTSSDPGMKSVGYREIAEMLGRGQDDENEEDLRNLIAAKTRQYAKRQMTWWRRDHRIHWMPQ